MLDLHADVLAVVCARPCDSEHAWAAGPPRAAAVVERREVLSDTRGVEAVELREPLRHLLAGDNEARNHCQSDAERRWIAVAKLVELDKAGRDRRPDPPPAVVDEPLQETRLAAPALVADGEDPRTGLIGHDTAKELLLALAVDVIPRVELPTRRQRCLTDVEGHGSRFQRTPMF